MTNLWAKAAGEFWRKNEGKNGINKFSDVLKSDEFKSYYASKYGSVKSNSSKKSKSKSNSKNKNRKTRRHGGAGKDDEPIMGESAKAVRDACKKVVGKEQNSGSGSASGAAPSSVFNFSLAQPTSTGNRGVVEGIANVIPRNEDTSLDTENPVPTEEPVTEAPAAGEQAVEEPVVEKPVVEEQAVEEQAVEEQAAGEPVTEAPAGEGEQAAGETVEAPAGEGEQAAGETVEGTDITGKEPPVSGGKKSRKRRGSKRGGKKRGSKKVSKRGSKKSRRM